MKKDQMRPGFFNRAIVALREGVHHLGVSMRRWDHRQRLAYHQKSIRKHHFKILEGGEKRLLKGEDLHVRNVITTQVSPKYHLEYSILCWDENNGNFYLIFNNNYNQHCAIRLCPHEEACNQIDQAQAKIFGIQLHFSDLQREN